MPRASANGSGSEKTPRQRIGQRQRRRGGLPPVHSDTVTRRLSPPIADDQLDATSPDLVYMIAAAIMRL
ncbi:hypothetical protein B0H13DRAFT_2300168 [Mycena leptocephala]|nr:hypothetical protein B0H13DRAFT_2300168 [Mycena leptocephala]